MSVPHKRKGRSAMTYSQKRLLIKMMKARRDAVKIEPMPKASSLFKLRK